MIYDCICIYNVYCKLKAKQKAESDLRAECSVFFVWLAYNHNAHVQPPFRTIFMALNFM